MKNPNELSATSSWRGNELQLIEQKANIVVGVANSRTRLRIGVLLSKYSEYQVDYISSEIETGKLIEEADLIIGAGITAYEGVLRRKPVIVVGDYGLGGLVTPDTFRKHYNNRFRGKINGARGESFSLENLEKEIHKGFNLTFQELQMMSNQTITLQNI